MVGVGTKLGECLWHGAATKEVRRRAESLGIKSPEEYDKILDGINPIDNLDNLPETIELHLPMSDRYIPTRYGEELIRALENSGKNPRIIRYNGCGHILTLLKYGASNRL